MSLYIIIGLASWFYPNHPESVDGQGSPYAAFQGHALQTGSVGSFLLNVATFSQGVLFVYRRAESDASYLC